MDIIRAENSKLPSKDTPKILQEEEISSKGKIPETCGNLTEADISTTSAHCEDASKDAVEPDTLVLDEDDEDAESTEDKKVEKYFSDIESSDDSLGYAPNKVSETLTTSANKSSLKALAIKFKPKVQSLGKNELDLEPVESEEEFFEDCVPLEDISPGIESAVNSPITTTPDDGADEDAIKKHVEQKTLASEVIVPEENVSDVKGLDKVEKEINENEEAISASQVPVGAEEEICETVVVRSEEESDSDEAELHIKLSGEEAKQNVNETKPERNEENGSIPGAVVERKNQSTKEGGPEVLSKCEEAKVVKVGGSFESVKSQVEENAITESLTETEKKPEVLEELNKSTDDQERVETTAAQQEEEQCVIQEEQCREVENEDSKDILEDENRSEEANLNEKQEIKEHNILMDKTEDTPEKDEPLNKVSELSEMLECRNVIENSEEMCDTSVTKSVDLAKDIIEKDELIPPEPSPKPFTEKRQKTDDKKEQEEHENPETTNVKMEKRFSPDNIEPEVKNTDETTSNSEIEKAFELSKTEEKKEDSDQAEKTTSSEAEATANKDDKGEVETEYKSENECKDKIKSNNFENKKSFDKNSHTENDSKTTLTKEEISKEGDSLDINDSTQKANELLITGDVATQSNQPSVESADDESLNVVLQDSEAIAVEESDITMLDDKQQKAKEDPVNQNLEKQSKQSKNELSIDDDHSKGTFKDDERHSESEKTKSAKTEKQSDESKITTSQYEKPEVVKDPSRLLDKSETARSTEKPDTCVKEDTTMKSADNGSGQSSAFEDEEPLLMIDTAHKEENENEYNEMDTETEQTQTTDSSSEGSLEIFYDKECVNYECKHESKNFFRSTLFALNFYKITKKRSRTQFVCEDCYDRALDSYEEMCKTLKQKQPLLSGSSLKAQEFVEIIDSSDEEETDCPNEKMKDENTLPKESIEMLEAELEGAIRKVMHNVEIQNQLSWTKQILQQRLTNLEEDTEFVSKQLRLLQKQADNMHNSLYQCPKIKIRQLTPLDLNSGRSYNPETESTIPPMGEVLRASIYVNETYYAVKNKAIASWVPCKVMEVVDNYLPHSKSIKHYKIKFLKSKYPMLKTVSAKHMAFFNPPKVRLPIGTRVIAYFDASTLSRGKEKMLIPSAFYPGIIAEPLKQSNKFRYLVFYDDGYFQYVYHKDVRLVCHASENVWEDVHHQSREFIHNYLTQYAVNRPMVQTQKGQSMLVDYNGKWIYARVIDVDCSLVQMLFEGQSRSEWIYRGSTRLGPVFKESNNMAQKTPWTLSRASRRTEPFIRYINGDDSSTSQPPESQQQQQTVAKPGEVRSVAKKSVSRTETSQFTQQPPVVRHLNNSTIFVDDDNKPKGKVVYYTARKNLPPRSYVPHICSPSCLFNVTHNLSFYSPLAKPLLSGWERQVFRQKSKKFIVYRGPCGKRMRSMEELHRYLRVTEDDLNVDNFDFSPETNCLAEYVIESCIVQKKDISNGKEKMPIPCVNYYDNTMPPDCVYSSRRIPTEGVPLNLDREFLVGCDCEDDCSDKSKCSCWELTYAGAKYGMPNVPNEMVGYQFKRLYEHVPTGIYECNSRCKCKSNCVNRVVQQSLQSKLQVFKTSNRGWGLRCINDVPRGSFICVYAGHLLTEAKANEGGLDAGDEYFAELDYIEVAEQIKEGYESDVVEPDEDEELYNPDKDEDDDEFVAPESHRNRSFNTRLRTRRTTKGSTDVEHDSQERQVISFEPNKTIGQPDTSNSEKPTIRKLFGKDEACYIMDAKVTGNLGRYFNHSCSPNLFVQNVFVDTHDLRFPWVAFFAFTHIRAGTELTWNYNYEVGVVPGKVLYCQCGAPNCRQRLL